MKISALRLFNVKRFANRGVAIEGIGDGVNVLCAANEFGKSTSFEALHALFFQPHGSVANDVKALRPYSGGSPIVEADIATNAGRFRITKQFYGGRSARVTDLGGGRLVAQADEAENFIASLIRGGTAGPAGLLWVRQGITGIERRSKAEEDGDTRLRSSLLTSVQGEVEAITGGRRMAEIIEGAKEELLLLVTNTTKNGKPKTNGRYANAIAERDKHSAEEQKLAAEVTALRKALDERTAATRRLAELDRPEDRQERRAAVEKAEAAFDLAKAQSDRLKAAEAGLLLARQQRDMADKTLADFRKASTEASALQARLVTAGQQREAAISQRSEIADRIALARREEEAAEIEEKAARDRLDRLDRALRAREAAARLAELHERLEKADAIRIAMEETEAQIRLAKIPPASIDELQKLEIEITRLRAIEETARPSVAIAYQPGATGAVTLDGTPLGEGAWHGYDGQAELSVPGVGTITLRSSRPPGSGEKLRQAEEKQRSLLAAMGVDSLAAARERQVRADQLGSHLQSLAGQLKLLAPDGMQKLRDAVAALGAVDEATPEPEGDAGAAQDALSAAEARRKLARQSLSTLEPAQPGVQEAFVAAETGLAEIRTGLTHVEAVLGPVAERAAREEALATTLSDRAFAYGQAESEVLRLRAETGDIDAAEAALRRARSVEAAAEKEIGTLQQAIAGLNGLIQARANEAVEERWRETAEQLAAATARVQNFEKEVAVLQRLVAALEAARSQARDLYLKPVMTELKPLLGLLFDDVSITFDDRTLLPQSILRNGQEEDVERLSGGMREQLSVLTRLAFARLLARDGRPAPVILDDALVYSDDDRIEKMFDALHRQSRDQQIIVFSCRQRAFQRLGGNVLGMTDWRP